MPDLKPYLWYTLDGVCWLSEGLESAWQKKHSKL